MALEERIRELEAELSRARETLDAIGSGKVDAVVVSGPAGPEILALRAIEPFTESILESSQETILFCEADGRILRVSRATHALCGCNPEMLLLEDAFPVFLEGHPLDLQSLLQGKALRGVEVEVRLSAERRVPMLLSANRVQNERAGGGASWGIMLLFIDITEKKKREQLLGSIIVSLPDAVVVADAAGRLVYANEKAGRSVDLDSVEALTALSVEEFFHRLDFHAEDGSPLSEADHPLAQVREDLRPLSGILRIRAPGGRDFRWVRLHTGRAGDGDELTLISIHDITDLKLFEEERAKSENRWRSLVDSNILGILFWTFDGQIVDANTSFLDMLGYSWEDLVAGRLNYMELTPPEWRHLDEVALQELRARGLCTPFEKEYLRKDGSRVPVLLAGAVIKGSSGGMAYVLDITERKRAEVALKQSRERLRLALETADLGTWDFNPQSGRMRLSARARRILGFDAEANPGFETLLALAVPEDRERLRDRVRSAFSGEEEVRGLREEFRIQRGDGEIRWLVARGKVFPSEAEDPGRPAGIIGTVIDITDRKRFEDEIKESRDRLHAILDHVGEGIVVQKADGSLFYGNPAAERLIGFTPQGGEKALGMEEIFAGLDIRDKENYPVAAARLPHALVMRDREPAELMLRIAPSARGKEARLLTRSAPVFDREGALSLVVTIFSDITESLSAQEALRRSEEALRQSQKMEAIGRLAGGIAHDFNNLLTAINGYSELLMALLDREDPHVEHLREISKAGHRAAALTSQLLAFSRKQVLSFRIFDLNEAVKSFIGFLRRTLGENVELSVETASLPLSIRADQGQVEQCLLNLCINGRDAMPQGGRMLVRTGFHELEQKDLDPEIETLKPGSYACLSVRDTGIGMSEEVLAHLYEPFFTTKEIGRGTGLGLSSVYGIVRQTGGFIRVESGVGRGTTFSVFLPLHQEEEGLRPGTGKMPVLKRGKERILLVEDEKVVRQFTATVLRSAGYTVIEAGDAAEGLTVQARCPEPIDLLLSDVVMPGKNGRELAEELKPQRPLMKILFMSGYTDDELIRHGIRESRDHFLQKPFTPESLLRKVREALDTAAPAA